MKQSNAGPSTPGPPDPTLRGRKSRAGGPSAQDDSIEGLARGTPPEKPRSVTAMKILSLFITQLSFSLIIHLDTVPNCTMMF
jgi:hypothetical protein